MSAIAILCDTIRSGLTDVGAINLWFKPKVLGLVVKYGWGLKPICHMNFLFCMINSRKEFKKNNGCLERALNTQTKNSLFNISTSGHGVPHYRRRRVSPYKQSFFNFNLLNCIKFKYQCGNLTITKDNYSSSINSISMRNGIFLGVSNGRSPNIG